MFVEQRAGAVNVTVTYADHLARPFGLQARKLRPNGVWAGTESTVGGSVAALVGGGGGAISGSVVRGAVVGGSVTGGSATG